MIQALTAFQVLRVLEVQVVNRVDPVLRERQVGKVQMAVLEVVVGMVCQGCLVWKVLQDLTVEKGPRVTEVPKVTQVNPSQVIQADRVFQVLMVYLDERAKLVYKVHVDLLETHQTESLVELECLERKAIGVRQDAWVGQEYLDNQVQKVTLVSSAFVLVFLDSRVARVKKA